MGYPYCSASPAHTTFAEAPMRVPFPVITVMVRFMNNSTATKKTKLALLYRQERFPRKYTTRILGDPGADSGWKLFCPIRSEYSFGRLELVRKEFVPRGSYFSFVLLLVEFFPARFDFRLRPHYLPLGLRGCTTRKIHTKLHPGLVWMTSFPAFSRLFVQRVGEKWRAIYLSI